MSVANEIALRAIQSIGAVTLLVGAVLLARAIGSIVRDIRQ